MGKRKRHAQQVPSIDSTLVLGDITQVSQITRSGSTVTVHGETNRSYSMASESDAAQLWQALAEEASEAVREDRQFFCVSVGGEPVGDYVAGDTLH